MDHSGHRGHRRPTDAREAGNLRQSHGDGGGGGCDVLRYWGGGSWAGYTLCAPSAVAENFDSMPPLDRFHKRRYLGTMVLR